MKPLTIRFYFALALLTMTGCGVSSGQMANLVPVTGTVLLDGKPLDHGTVGFAPVNQAVGQPAVGQIKNGEFTMITTLSLPGVVAGHYKVSIICLDESIPEKPLPPGFTPDPNAPPPDRHSLIPTKYENSATSGLKVNVEPGIEPIEFNLKPGT